MLILTGDRRVTLELEQTLWFQFSSVQFLSHVWLLCNPMDCTTPGLPVQTARAYSNSSPSSHWGHPPISSSIVPLFSCPQSLPASESFPMSQFFASGGQSIGVSASASVLTMIIQEWFPLRLTGWISLQSKGLSRIFQHHSSKASILQPSAFLWSNSHIHTWLLQKA